MTDTNIQLAAAFGGDAVRNARKAHADRLIGEVKQEAKWNDALFAARPHPMTHAIIAAMLGRKSDTPQQYAHSATLTSDGFVMAGFTDGDGRYHYGAFVSSYSEILRNVRSVAEVEGVPLKHVDALLLKWLGR